MQKSALSRFSVENFLSHRTETKNFVGEPFGVSENFGYRNFSCRGGGGASRFGRKFFVSQDQNEKLRRGTLLCFRKILVSKNFIDKRGGGIAIFCLLIKLKKCRQRLGFETMPTASKPCCPTHCAMGTIGMVSLTKISQIIKIFGTTETRTPTYSFRTLLSYPMCHGNHWNGIFDKSQSNHINIWHDRDSNRKPTA